jgi:hypothetical protein
MHIILLPFITVPGIIFLFTSNSRSKKTLSNHPLLCTIQTLFLGYQVAYDVIIVFFQKHIVGTHNSQRGWRTYRSEGYQYEVKNIQNLC